MKGEVSLILRPPTPYSCEDDAGNNVCLGIYFTQVLHQKNPIFLANQNTLESNIFGNKTVD